MRGQRFYEKHPTVNKAVELLFVFPRDFQTIIATGLSAIAQKEYQVDQRLKEVKSLGSEKILAFHKSKQKKRPYDENPVVHDALNHLMILSEDERIFVSTKIIELVGFIQEYMQTCKVHEIPPDVSTMEAISTIYVQYGPDQSKKLLTALKEEFTRKIERRSAPVSQVKMVERIHSDMRIKGERPGA